MDETIYFLALNMATGLGPKKKQDLLNHIKDIKTLFSIGEQELRKIIKGNIQSTLITERNTLLDRAEKELNKAKQSGVGVTHIHAKDYPGNLLSIPDPPIALYYKGDLSKDDFNSISVVGCRDATSYGLNNSHRLGRELSEKGITVVSGLAKGIDYEAHKGALEGKGRTVAVLGCGIDKVYPKDHHKLQDQIATEGCLYTEYPFGTEPKGFHFPIRNRIICGLGVGVVVVEGSRDSGSLYTAQFALDYGREVYAFPGPVQNYNYSGTHLLIKKGAKLIENTNDLLEDLSLVLDLELITKKKKQKYEKKESQKLEKHEILLDTIVNTKNDFPLTKDEKIIYNCLSHDEKKPFDAIVEQSGLRVEKVMSNLSSLMLKEQCIQTNGNYYLKAS